VRAFHGSGRCGCRRNPSMPFWPARMSTIEDGKLIEVNGSFPRIPRGFSRIFPAPEGYLRLCYRRRSKPSKLRKGKSGQLRVRSTSFVSGAREIQPGKRFGSPYQHSRCGRYRAGFMRRFKVKSAAGWFRLKHNRRSWTPALSLFHVSFGDASLPYFAYWRTVKEIGNPMRNMCTSRP
jgi:hypothetical protein